MQIYNSLTRQKEAFVPMEAGKVRMYVCGMTVYDYCHLGHARMMAAFDVVVRYLRYRDYEVTFVRNITDIDDKIIAKAQAQGVDISTLTQTYITAMHEDAQALNLLPPDIEPRATDYIPQMISFIQQLMDKDIAYQAASGDICYRVSRFPNYGALSHKDIDGLLAGARIEVAADKDNPLDFVLWKLAKPNEPAWSSPWGEGRPGWHIECSVMSIENLGQTFDIHGGGSDLQFPHHENEIAQSEAVTEKPFAKVWMHNGFVQVNAEKMSKSLNNFFTIRDVLQQYSAEVVRYFLISSHYRSQINYSDDTLENASAALTRFYLALRDLPPAEPLVLSDYEARFVAAMDDDFNTPEALAVLFEIAREINRVRITDQVHAARLGATMVALGQVLGLLQQDAEHFLSADSEVDATWVDAQIAARQLAREQKDWARSDQIRDALAAQQIVLEDGPNGTTWRRG